MAEATFDRATLRIEAEAGGRWRLRCGEADWSAEPALPTTDELLQIKWLMEDAASTPQLDEYREHVRAWAAESAKALWSSLVAPAPDALRSRLEARRPHLEIAVPDETHVAALSLLDPEAEESGPSASLRMCVMPALDRPARKNCRLRLLHVIARPLGANDAPYLSVAQPLAEAASALGIRYEHLFPARRRELASRLAAARAADDPYTMLVFDGHGLGAGATRGYVALESKFGIPALLDAEEFLDCLGEDPPPLILLLACRTADTSDILQNPTTFAGDLARRSRVEVIGMNYNITPALAGRFASDFLRSLVEEADVAAAFGRARKTAAGDNASLLYAAPIHFSSAPLTLLTERRDPLPAPPPGLALRQFECRLLDDALVDSRMHFLVGGACVGMSTFLDAYDWWFGHRAGGYDTVRIDARHYPSPAALAAAWPPATESTLVIVDNGGHWAGEPVESWAPLLERIGGAGCKCVIASHVAPNLPEPFLFTGQALFGLGGAATRGSGEVREVARAWFDAELDEDPWILPLVIASRGEPMLLGWMGARFKQGMPGSEILERFIFPSEALAAELAAGADMAALDHVDPMLGWLFGLDQRRIIAALDLPPDQWETEAMEEAVARLGNALAAAGDRCLAYRFGSAWMLSSTHATILRARAPADRWSPEARARYCGFVTFVGDVFELFGTSADADLPRMDPAISTVDRFGRVTISAHRATLAELLLALPNAYAGAVMAGQLGRMDNLGDIVAGIARILTEFEGDASGLALAEHWHPIVSDAHRRRTAPNASPAEAEGALDAAMGLDSIEETLERLALLSGAGGFASAGVSRLRLAAGSQAGQSEEAEDHNVLIYSVIQAFRNGTAGPRGAGKLKQLLQAIMLLAGPGTAQPPDIGLMMELRELMDGTISSLDALMFELTLSNMLLRQHDWHSAEIALERARAIANPSSAYQQYLLAISTAETLQFTGGPNLLEAAKEGVRYAKMLGDNASVGLAQLQLAGAYGAQGDCVQARNHCGEAIPKLVTMHYYYVHALATFAKFTCLNGELELSRAYCARVLAITATPGPLQIYLETLVIVAMLGAISGNRAEIESGAKRLLEEAQANNFAHGEGVARWLIGEVHYEDDEYEEAERQARLAIGMLRPTPFEGYSARAWALIAKSAFLRDDFDVACDAQSNAAVLFEEHFSEPAGKAEQWAELEMIALCAEQLDVAHMAIARVEEFSPDIEVRSVRQAWISALGWSYFGETPLARARAAAALRNPEALTDDLVKQLREIVGTPRGDD